MHIFIMYVSIALMEYLKFVYLFLKQIEDYNYAQHIYVLDEGYSRNASYALNLTSTFLLEISPNTIYKFSSLRHRSP